MSRNKHISQTWKHTVAHVRTCVYKRSFGNVYPFPHAAPSVPVRWAYHHEVTSWYPTTNCSKLYRIQNPFKNGSLGGLCDGTKRHRQIPESVEPHFIEQTNIGQLVSRGYRTCTAPEIPQDLPAAALFVVQATENNYISMCWCWTWSNLDGCWQTWIYPM